MATEQANVLSSDYCLPYICLQPDFSQVCTDISEGLHGAERAWLSIYCLNAPGASIHAKALVSLANSSRRRVDLQIEEPSSQFLRTAFADASSLDIKVGSASRPSSRSARGTVVNLSVPEVTIRVPTRTLGPLARGSLGITAFDVSHAGNDLYVAAGADGQAHVASLQSSSSGGPAAPNGSTIQSRAIGIDDIEALAQQRMQERLQERLTSSKVFLKGHVGDVLSAKFFPSGEVVLTSSSDCTTRIFGIDGSNPRTLIGHRRAINDTAFIDRGKQVVTASSDGSSRLWDVSEGKQLANLASQDYSSVNAIHVAQDEGSSSNSLLTGLSNGSVEAHDLTSRSVPFRIPASAFPIGPAPAATDSWEQVKVAGILSLDRDKGSHRLLIGSSNGVVALYDDRALRSSEHDPNQAAIYRWRRNGAAINSISLINGGTQALIATADGTPYRVALDSDEPHIIDEYNGWDVDNVQSACLGSHSRIWLAGAGGMARCYGI